MHAFLAIVLSYLLGSIPAAYLAGKVFKGIDLRQHGSRSLGATNVYRVMGWKLALLVFVFDAAKGMIPVLVFARWIESPESEWWPIACGVTAIAGHVRPVFLRHGGGKGVATATGVFAALAPLPVVIAFAVWVAMLLATGYVSLSSLTSAVVMPVAVLAYYGLRSPLFAVSTAMAVFVFWTHRANIGRLRRGEESRFGGKKAH
ncbi:MAG: glycerol-3-phosphate 1-O-acyltransferase PlsY [Gemmatimonadaceae bacterium]